MPEILSSEEFNRRYNSGQTQPVTAVGPEVLSAEDFQKRYGGGGAPVPPVNSTPTKPQTPLTEQGAFSSLNLEEVIPPAGDTYRPPSMGAAEMPSVSLAEEDMYKTEAERLNLQRIAQDVTQHNNFGANVLRGATAAPYKHANTGTFGEALGGVVQIIPTLITQNPVLGFAQAGALNQALQNYQDSKTVYSPEGTLDFETLRKDVPTAAAKGGVMGLTYEVGGKAGAALGSKVLGTPAKNLLGTIGEDVVASNLGRFGGSVVGGAAGGAVGRFATEGEDPNAHFILQDLMIGGIMGAPGLMHGGTPKPSRWRHTEPLPNAIPDRVQPAVHEALSEALYPTKRAEVETTRVPTIEESSRYFEQTGKNLGPITEKAPTGPEMIPMRSSRSDALGAEIITDAPIESVKATLEARQRELGLLLARDAEAGSIPKLDKASEQRKAFLREQIPLLQERLGMTPVVQGETIRTEIGTSRIIGAKEKKKAAKKAAEEAARKEIGIIPDMPESSFDMVRNRTDTLKAEVVEPTEFVDEFPAIKKVDYQEIHITNSKKEFLKAIRSSTAMSNAEKVFTSAVARHLPESIFTNSNALRAAGLEVRIGGTSRLTDADNTVQGMFTHGEFRTLNEGNPSDPATYMRDLVHLYNERSPLTGTHEVGAHWPLFRLMDGEQFNSLVERYKKTEEYAKFVEARKAELGPDGMTKEDAPYNRYANSFDEWAANNMTDWLTGLTAAQRKYIPKTLDTLFRHSISKFVELYNRVKGVFNEKPEVVKIFEDILRRGDEEGRVLITRGEQLDSLRKQGLSATRRINEPSLMWHKNEPKAPRVAEPGTEQAKYEKMLEMSRIEGEKYKRGTLTPTQAIRRQFTDRAVMVTDSLKKIGGRAAHIARMEFDTIGGSHSYAAYLVDQANRHVYEGLSGPEEALLNNVIHSMRSVAIAKNYDGVKRPGGFGGDIAEKYLANAKKNLGPQQYAKIEAAANRYFDVMRGALKNLREARIIDEKTYQNLLEKSPYSKTEFFKYLDPVQEYDFGKGRKISVTDSGLPALGKGDIDLANTDSRLLMQNVLARTEGRIRKNNANRALYALSQVENNFDLVRPLGDKQTPDAGHVELSVMHEGKAHKMQVPTEFAHDWVTGNAAINNSAINILGTISGSKFVKFFATGADALWAVLVNLPMDFVSPYFNTYEYSWNPVTYPFARATDMAMTFKDAVGRKGEYVQYLKDGGGLEFLAQQGKLGGEWFKNTQALLAWTGNTTEAWGRLSLRRRALLNGKESKEATWIARHALDYHKGGYITKSVDPLFPYINASVQGSARIVEAFKENKPLFMWKVANAMAFQFALTVGAIMVNRKAYEDTSEEVKIGNFLLTTPFPSYTDDNGNTRYKTLTIPMFQGIRPFVTLARMSAEYAMGVEIKPGKNAKSILDFFSVAPSSFVPPIIKSALSYILNKDFNTGKDISKDAGKVLPKDEYTERTNQLFINAGQQADKIIPGGLSPDRMQRSLEQVFTQDNLILNLLGYGLKNRVEEVSEGDAAKEKEMWETLSNTPGLKRIFRVTNPYTSFSSTHELARMEEGSRKALQDREFEPLLKNYWEGGRKDSDLGKIRDFIQKQEWYDIERFMQAYTSYGVIAGTKDKGWWLSLKSLSPEVRARMFYKKYEKMRGTKEGEETLQKARVFFPASDRFWAEFNVLDDSTLMRE